MSLSGHYKSIHLTQWAILEIVALLIAILPIHVVFAQSSPSSPATFSEELNPTGDPLGGGPGYTGAYRTEGLGLSGEGIYTASDADHIVNTTQGLLDLMQSYYDESASRTIMPSSPASSGDVIFVDTDLDLTGYHFLRIPAGVTLASDRGYDNGDGTYEWGALIQVRVLYDKTNGVMQRPLLEDAGADVRITGLRIKGPSSWAQIANVNVTDTWQGGALGIKHTTKAGTFEVDNCEIYGWDNWAIWLYRVVDDYVHHNWIHHTRREGYGYGLWSGTPPNEFVEVPLEVRGNVFSFNRHTTDNRSTTDGHEQVVKDFSNNVIADFHQRNVINDHATNLPGGTLVAGWKRNYVENLFLEIQSWISVKAPLSGGYLKVEGNWLEAPDPCAAPIAGYGPCIYDPHHPSYDPNYKDLFADPIGDITTAGNHFNAASRILPKASASLGAATTTAGSTVTLDLSGSFDPDGHTIRFHEVIWGDGEDAIDDVGRSITEASSIEHTFSTAGVYHIRVRAFNEHGVPSEAQILNLTVEPVSGTPALTFAVACDWPQAVTQESGDDWTGYYMLRVKANGSTVWQSDAGDMDGWARVSIEDEGYGQADTLRLTYEIETLQTIADPSNLPGGAGTEPGEVSLYVDNAYLLGTDVANAVGVYHDQTIPSYDVTEASAELADFWGTINTEKRDTPSDHGYLFRLTSFETTIGTTSSKTATFDLMGAPTLDVYEGDTEVLLAWSPIVGADGYEVRYSTTSGGPYTPVNMGSDLYYWHTGLTNAQAYYFEARSYGKHVDSGETIYSSWSNEITATPAELSAIANRLVAAWTFDETGEPYADSKGGQPFEGSAGTQTGIHGDEATFNGSQDLKTDGYPPLLRVADQDVSVEMWVTIQDDTFIGSYAGFLSDGGGGSNGSQGIWFGARNEDIHWTPYLGFSNGSVRSLNGGGTASFGVRHQVVYTLNRDGDLVIYLDGAAVKRSEIAAYDGDHISNPTARHLLLNNGFISRIAGAIDEVRVWNGRALMQADVDWLYNGGTGRSNAEFLVSDVGENKYIQRLNLLQGWNLVSSYVEPDDARMEAIFGDVAPEIMLVQNDEGKILSFENGINEIGVWNPRATYKIYSKSAVTFTIEGSAVLDESTPIPLEKGWNGLPFLCSEPIPVEEALASIAQSLVLVKDHAGQVYYPKYGINSIGSLQPGRGYSVYVNHSTDLVYPDISKSDT